VTEGFRAFWLLINIYHIIVLIGIVRASVRSTMLPEGSVWTTDSPFSALWIIFQYAVPSDSIRMGVSKPKQAVLNLGSLLLLAVLRCRLAKVYASNANWVASGAWILVPKVVGSGVPCWFVCAPSLGMMAWSVLPVSFSSNNCSCGCIAVGGGKI